MIQYFLCIPGCCDGAPCVDEHCGLLGRGYVTYQWKCGYKVKVGSVAHPMEEKHYIEWIQAVADGKTYRRFLSPGDAPEAKFMIDAEQITAREYCNLHGLWKA